MPEPFKPGCKRPEVSKLNTEASKSEFFSETKKELKSLVKVGEKAPDFELAGYQKGEFLNFKLSEYLGKWVVLCFYPGDFTFV